MWICVIPAAGESAGYGALSFTDILAPSLTLLLSFRATVDIWSLLQKNRQNVSIIMMLTTLPAIVRLSRSTEDNFWIPSPARLHRPSYTLSLARDCRISVLPSRPSTPTGHSPSQTASSSPSPAQPESHPPRPVPFPHRCQNSYSP